MVAPPEGRHRPPATVGCAAPRTLRSRRQLDALPATQRPRAELPKRVLSIRQTDSSTIWSCRPDGCNMASLRWVADHGRSAWPKQSIEKAPPSLAVCRERRQLSPAKGASDPGENPDPGSVGTSKDLDPNARIRARPGILGT